MRKRIVMLLIAFYCVTGMAGCGQTDASSDLPDSDAEPGISTGSPSEQEWTEEELIALFEPEDDWEILDCAAVPDGAFDRVGVILFWDEESETTCAAFLDAEGGYQRCGTPVQAAEDPALTYLGNGTVQYNLCAEDGTPYQYKLTFSLEGGRVSFKAEEDLIPPEIIAFPDLA